MAGKLQLLGDSCSAGVRIDGGEKVGLRAGANGGHANAVASESCERVYEAEVVLVRPGLGRVEHERLGKVVRRTHPRKIMLGRLPVHRERRRARDHGELAARDLEVGDQVLRRPARRRNDEAVAQAVARSTADELRRLERETATALPTFRGSRLEDPFIRQARAGTGAEELSPAVVARIVEAWPEALARAGYAR